MLGVICKYLPFLDSRVLKASFLLLFVALLTVLGFKLTNSSAMNFSGLFLGADKISQLDAHLSDSKWSTNLAELEIREITPEEAEVFLFILKLSNSITPPDARKLAKVIVDECGENDLDPFLILAMIQTESNFIPKAVSSKGAIGLMQVMPRTGEFVAKHTGISFNGIRSLYDPFVNVKLGIQYLSILEDQFDSLEYALAAYNYGPTKFANSDNLANNPPRYVRKVLDFKSFLEEESILLAKNS